MSSEICVKLSFFCCARCGLQVFHDGAFLEGSTLAECYASVAKVADRWLDVIDSAGPIAPPSAIIILPTRISFLDNDLIEKEAKSQ